MVRRGLPGWRRDTDRTRQRATRESPSSFRGRPCSRRRPCTTAARRPPVWVPPGRVWWVPRLVREGRKAGKASRRGATFPATWSRSRASVVHRVVVEREQNAENAARPESFTGRPATRRKPAGAITSRRRAWRQCSVLRQCKHGEGTAELRVIAQL